MAMTFEQYKELRKKGYSQEQLQKLNTENKPKGFFQKLGASLSKRKSNITNEAQNFASGSITKPEYYLRGTGQVAGAFGDVVGQAVGAAGKFAFNALPGTTQSILKTAGTKALQSKPGQLAMGGLQAGADKYGRFAEANPRLATNLAAVGNIATAFPIGKGVGMAGKEAVNAAIDTGKATAIAAKETGKAITGSLEKNVGKAVGMTGRMRLGDVEQSIPKAVNAFRTIAKNAKNTVVKDVDGIEKAFDPVNATFSETLQALKQTKDKLYNDWTKMAKEAGEQGVTFTGDDFGRAIAELQQTTANSTSAWRNKVQSLIDDITKNYADVTPDGQVIFRAVDPADIQKFIERINVDINPMSDKAGSEVSALLSRSLREMMDKKIDSTGPGYQALRNQYAELKSIENGLINQFKKSTRGVGNGVSQWVDGFGTLDTIVGLLTARPEAALRGVGMSLLAKTMKSLRDPENALKRSFKRILEENGQKFIPKSKTFKLLNKAKGKGGMSIQDISRSGLDVTEKEWDKLNTSAFMEALKDYGRKLEKDLNKAKSSPKINLDRIGKLEDAMEDVKAAQKSKGGLSPEAAKMWSAKFKKLGIDFDEYYSLPQAMKMKEKVR